MLTAGIDCGAKNTKTMIVSEGRIIGRGSVPTGFDQEKAVVQSLEMALAEAGILREEIERIFGTGTGAGAIAVADDRVNDIKAIARGASFFFPDARTVVDVGAEEARAVKINGKGNPVDFVVNDKCAAGAGAFIEAMARALETPLEEMGPLALESDKEISMNAQCAIFAESEVVGLIHAGAPKKEISKAIHDSMAGRIVSMIRRIGINAEVVLLGGLGNNPAFAAALKRELNLDNIRIPDRPEFGVAVGAALLAAAAAQAEK